jgi:hypothetical protein
MALQRIIIHLVLQDWFPLIKHAEEAADDVQTEVLMEVRESICRLLCAKYVDLAKTPARIMLLLPSGHVPAAASQRKIKIAVTAEPERPRMMVHLRESVRARKEEHSRLLTIKGLFASRIHSEMREDFIQL